MTTGTGDSPRSSGIVGAAEVNDRSRRIVDRTESFQSSESSVFSCLSELDWELVESPAIARAGSPYDTIPLPEVDGDNTEEDRLTAFSLPANCSNDVESPFGSLFEGVLEEETEGEDVERVVAPNPFLDTEHLLWSIEGTMSSEILQTAEFYRPELMIPCDNSDLEAPPPVLQASVRHRCIPLPDIDDEIESETLGLLWATSISAAPTPLIVTPSVEDSVASLGGSALGAWSDWHVIQLTLCDVDDLGDSSYDEGGRGSGYSDVGVVDAVDGADDEEWVLLIEGEDLA